MATVVSIGRNVGENGPMTAAHWAAFRLEATNAVARYAGPIVFGGTGAGTYDGRPEESFTVVGADDMLTTPIAHREEFARYIADLATKYGQNSIAVTSGETRFVEGTPLSI